MKKFKQKFTVIDGEERFTVDLSEVVRPSFSIPETQQEDGTWKLEHNQGVWNPIVTKIHIPDGDDSPEIKILFNLFSKAFAFTDPNLVHKTECFFEGSLELFDESDRKVEEWKLTKMWPQAINFGELSYSTTADIDIEVSWRFSGCNYTNLSSIVSN